MDEEPIRLNKYLGKIGFCSRREADKLIEQKRILVNGEFPVMGTKVTPADKIQVDGELIKDRKKKNVYIAFNKPVGIVCTTDTRVEKDNIIDFINYPSRIFPIGRLDKASEGLIFLTDDGSVVNKVLRAKYQHEKEYWVRVNKPIQQDFIEGMSNGVPILDQVTMKCHVEQTGTREFKIILTQGLNRQIRRMCEYFDYKVVKLKRIRIMSISLDVPPGKWRHLTNSEVTSLFTNRLD